MKLKKINLISITDRELSEKQMNCLSGGTCCTCACAYENRGGSTTNANFNANTQNGHYDDTYNCSSNETMSYHINC